MRAHTPGPWMVLRDPDVGGPLVATDDVAIAEVMEMEGGMSEANARLIAAAPKMLEGLKLAAARLARVDGGDSMVVSTLLDVIHGATGEDFDVAEYIAAEDSEAEGES